MKFTLTIAIIAAFASLAVCQDQTNFYNIASIEQQQQQQQKDGQHIVGGDNYQRRMYDVPSYYNNDVKQSSVLLRGPNANSVLIGTDGSIVSSQATSGYIASSGRLNDMNDDEVYGPLAYRQYVYPAKFNVQYVKSQQQQQQQQQQSLKNFDVENAKKF